MEVDIKTVYCHAKTIERELILILKTMVYEAWRLKQEASFPSLQIREF